MLCPFPAGTSFRDAIVVSNEIFSDKILLDKHRRDREIVEAIEKYGYSQKEVADYVGLHYSTISRLVNKDNLVISKSKT